jgi:hypothetical protein
MINRRASLMTLIVLLVCAGCGANNQDASNANGVYTVDEATERFSEEGIELEVTRDLRDDEGSSVLQAIMSPSDPAFAETFAVNLLRGAEEAQAFVKNVEQSDNQQHTLVRGNVVLVYDVPADSDLAKRLTTVMDSL